MGTTKASELEPEQQIVIFKTLCCQLHYRILALMIELEQERNIRDHYGTTIMDSADRLYNRLFSDLVISNNGIPSHDDEALKWLKKTLDEDHTATEENYHVVS